MSLQQFKQASNSSDTVVAVSLLVIVALLSLSKYVHYLFFHTLIEIISIVVSFSIFILAWTSKRYLTNGYLIILGGAFGAIGVIDVFHTLTYQGMQLFPGVTSNHPTQFWIAARFLEALALMCAPLFIARNPNFYRVSACFITLAAIACGLVALQWLPPTYIDGSGLTPFKIFSEYIIMSMLLVGLYLLYRARAYFEPRLYVVLSVSLWMAVASEFCFTRYAFFYDLSNELGHYFRFGSVFFAFVALVHAGIRQPLNLIFRQLNEVKERYRLAFDTSPDAININRMSDGLYLDVNESFLRMTGWARDDVIGKSSLDIGIWHDLSDRQRLVDALLADGSCKNLEACFVRKDGSLVTALMSAHVIMLEEEKCILSVTRDITERKNIEAALQLSEQRYRTLVEWTPQAVAVHCNGKLLYVNPATIRMLGASSQEDLVGKPFLDFIPPEFHDVVMARVKKQAEEGISVPEIEEKFLRMDGTVIDVIVQATPILYDGSTAFHVAMQDITAVKHAQEKLARAQRQIENSEVHYKTLIQNAADAVFVFDLQGRFVEVNHQACERLGYSREELLTMCLQDITPGFNLAERALVWKTIALGKPYNLTATHRRKDGYCFPVEIRTVALQINDEKLMMALASDISARVQMEEQIRQLAFYDSLTKLPNRRLLDDRLALAMAASRRSNNYGAVMFLDLDNFKPLNDRYGHTVGDLLLIEVANRLTACVREIDTVARFGGDEFVVMISEVSTDKAESIAQAGIIAEKIRTKLQEPYSLTLTGANGEAHGFVEHRCSTSIGIAMFLNHEGSQVDLLKWADSALYQAKASGRNAICFYHSAA